MVDVVIPAYNRRKFIGETVDSVLAQTYKDLEIIVVDDGSTDCTGDYLKSRYAKESRFRYIWQENAERSVARNLGIKAGSGEYVAFLDSDDLWLPEKLEATMRLLLANPEMVMAVTWFDLIDDKFNILQTVKTSCEPDVTGKSFAIRMVAQNQIGSPTPVIRRQALFDAGLFCLDPQVLCFEDWELWTRVSCFGKVGVVPQVLARHRIHPGNTEKALTPEYYITVVANMKRVLSATHWNELKNEALKCYWTRLKNTPPQNLYQRVRAVYSGVYTFGSDFYPVFFDGSRLDFVRFLIGKVTLSRLRRLRTALCLGRS